MPPRRRRGANTLVAGLLLGVSACASPETAQRQGAASAAPASQGGHQPGEAPLKAALQALTTSDGAGHTGRLDGVGFVNVSPAPVVPLEKRSVSLVPSTPDLEATLGAIARKWRAGGRSPLPMSELQAAFALLDRHVQAVRALGGEPFLRFAETDDKGRFAFDAIPAGRWVLVTSLESPVSALLWAIPGDVDAGKTVQVIVGNGNILLEGQAPPGKEPTTR